MDLTERTVSSQTIFEGHIVKLTVDQVRLPDGNLAGREVVHHPGGVAVLALDEENNVFLVRQYRYPIRQLLLELPDGRTEGYLFREIEFVIEGKRTARTDGTGCVLKK